MAISSNPSHIEIQNEFTNNNASTSLRAMLNTVFGNATGNMKQFAGKGRPTCTTNGVSNVGTTDVTLHGTVNSTGGVSCQWSFKFRRANTTNSWNYTGWHAASPNTSYTEYVGDFITADRTYEYRFLVSNVFDNEASGGENTWISAPTQPQSFVAGAVDSNCTSTFTWNHPTSGQPANYQYRVDWNSTGYSGWNTISGATTSLSFTGQDSDTLTVQLRAMNADGYTSTSVQDSVTYFCGGGGDEPIFQ